MSKLTNDIFIQRSIKIHNNKYDYSLVNYVNTRTKVKIICRKHGTFEQLPSAHLRGQTCKKCNNTNSSNNNFILESIKIHNNKYDYSLVNYINNKIKVKIICKKHGTFEQLPNSHTNGHGCNKCAVEYKSNIFRNSDIISNMSIIHNNKYDYSLVNYVNNKTKIKIICKKHGVFEQVPNSHIKGMGCHFCGESVGESTISKLLKQKNIYFIKQKTFEDCRNKNKLPFDFYIPNLNMCIEFDGKQHFIPIEYWGGEETFSKIKNNDKIKNNYCIVNNIKLLRINYLENIIEKLEEIWQS